ncbi:MAG: SPOR domain-containing protein [Thermodesulfobacteriota bacterium]|jgi:cell division septation protein DedD
MKFCPKCSLKIKGNLIYCPLCKVELLSCADDEDGEATSKVTTEEKQDSPAAELDNIISTADDRKDGPSTNEHRDSLQENTIDNFDRPDEDNDPKGSLKKLESNLNSLEKKLNLSLSQNDIFKGTVVDMQSWIKKLDISLAEIKKSLGSSNNYTQYIEKESSRLEPQIDQCVGELESVKNNLKDLHDKMNKLSEECRISLKISEDNKSKIRSLELYSKVSSPSFEEVQAQSSLPFGEIESSQEGISFPESEGEGLETDFEPSISPLSDEDISQPERVKKSNLPVIILSIIAATIISLWCGFYILNSREQSLQEENSSKRGKIVSVPKSVTSVELPNKTKTKPPPKTKIEEKDLKKPKKSSIQSSHSKKSTSVSKARTKKNSTPPKKSITASAPPKKSNGYTINVGSFQDKKRAQNLTKKLLEKGYPALMFPSMKNKWYRVKIGAFSSFKDARKYAATLNEKENLITFITKID